MTIHDDENATQPLEELGSGDMDLDQISGETIPLGDDDGGEEVGELPKFNFAKRLKIADHISSNTRQLVILACDRSGSMTGAKIDELNLARFALLRELADPQNKDGFYLGVIEFDHEARITLEPQSVLELHLPDALADGGTRFDAALEMASNMVRDFNMRPNPDGWNYLRSQVILLSDGYSPVSQHLIDDLQEVSNVWAVAYGGDADQQTLSRIASDGQVHFIGTQGGELRKFLAAVGETLSQGLANA